MKYNKILYIAVVAAILSACTKMDEIAPASGNFTQEQLQAVNASDPSRAEASFAGMFTKMGKPYTALPSSGRADDFGFVCIALSNDLEAGDGLIPDSGYNWFSVCGEYSSRTPSYANPFIRYKAPYNTIADANDIIKAFPDDANKIAQAKAVRAYAYQQLAPFFQGRYAEHADDPCIPYVDETTTNFTQNPRASVKTIWENIINDLTDAIEVLDAAGAPQRSSKAYVDANVAYGLRARAYLTIGEWQKAYDDAVKAAEGYTPATIAELAAPTFKDIKEHNWIWGYDMTPAVAQTGLYANSSSWMRSFSAEAYGPACQVYYCINKLLYDKISDTDVRKGWWVNESLESPLLEKVAWNGKSGADLSYLTIENVKEVFLPYTNVKFGCNECGTVKNDEDWPYMRVEEMLLIQAECQNNLGHSDVAKTILNNFVQKYRDESYDADACGRALADEIWFQRRVELWGEGFGVPDARRLHKPIVRTHGLGTTNMPDAFAFNLDPDDPWMNMRFSDSETNTNFAIVNNTGGSAPKSGDNADLRDGVTD